MSVLLYIIGNNRKIHLTNFFSLDPDRIIRTSAKRMRLLLADLYIRVYTHIYYITTTAV